MKATIKDTPDKEILMAMRAVGYDVDAIAVETLLNLAEFIKSKPEDDPATLKDAIRIHRMVKELFEE